MRCLFCRTDSHLHCLQIYFLKLEEFICQSYRDKLPVYFLNIGDMADKRKNEGKLNAFKENKEAARVAQRKEIRELDEFYKDYTGDVLVKGPKLPKFSEEEMPILAPGRFNMTISSKEYREKFLLAKETVEEAAQMEGQERDSNKNSDHGRVAEIVTWHSTPNVAESEAEKVALEGECQHDDEESMNSITTIPQV